MQMQRISRILQGDGEEILRDNVHYLTIETTIENSSAHSSHNVINTPASHHVQPPNHVSSDSYQTASVAYRLVNF